MVWFDMPRPALEKHRSATTAPDDLDDFWSRELATARAAAGPTTTVPHAPDLYQGVEVFDVEFSGGLGHRIRGWYLRPAGAGKRPVIVKFIGYGGGRGMPDEHLFWPAVGYGVLVMDSRGQGSTWTIGATGDPVTPEQAGPQFGGVMTRGILDPHDYYYTRMWADAVRAVDVAAELEGADPDRIGVTGGSQGGALTLAAAALNPDKVAWACPEIPFLCDIARAITLTDAMPYREIAHYLSVRTDDVEQARRTLSYIDCAVLAPRITAPVLMTTGLMDDICPPSTVFAAYNAIPGDKEIEVHDFMGHASPATFPERQAAHARRHLG